MQRRSFGPLEREVPVVGQGTWQLERHPRAQAVASLRRGLDLGMTHVDTAEMYGNGQAEEYVAEAIIGRRDEVFLVSKVLPQNATRRGTIKACEQSLLRLGTDYLDCYLLHWRGSTPLGETVAAFEELVDQGKIRSWGVSNFDVADLQEVAAIGARGGPVCNQVLYHLEERAIEHAVLPWCEEHRVALVGYSPFGHGDFPAPGTARGKVLAEVAVARGATARQVALRFLSRRPSLFAIPKAARGEHTDENARAGDLTLTAEDVARLDRVFPAGPSRELPSL